MRVAFVSGNREQLPDAVIPLGLLYVMAATPERHERALVDLCFVEDPRETLARELAEAPPDVVAVGMRNIQSGDYSGVKDTLSYYRSLMRSIRAATDAPVVFGGAGFSVMPAALMQELQPDFGIAGEGERAFPALLEALEAGDGFDAIASLHWRDAEGALRANPPAPDFLDMDDLRPPDRSRLDPRYDATFGIDSVQTKRGCPLRCDYCTYPIIEGRVGRRRAPQRVVDEILSIQERPGARHYFVVDSVFNLPTSHAKAVCREMIDRGARLPWTCYANPLGFDAELAGLMAEAGCAGMEVGSDGGSDAVLDRLRKGFSVRHIRDLHERARDAGLPDCHTFILGTPGETLDDVERTLDFIVDLDPFSVILMVWTDDAEAVDPKLATGRARLRGQIYELLERRKGDFPWWSIPALGVNYDPRLFAMLRKRGHHGPLWQHVRKFLPPPAQTS
jgi:radical SAM superfamily enzyme YgiQ (UPF0313 family)